MKKCVNNITSAFLLVVIVVIVVIIIILLLYFLGIYINTKYSHKKDSLTLITLDAYYCDVCEVKRWRWRLRHGREREREREAAL